MRPIELAVVLTLSLTLAPLASKAQQASHVPYIGVLYPESHRCTNAFREGLTDLGYVEGRTIAFEYRPGGTLEQQIEQVQDLARRKIGRTSGRTCAGSALRAELGVERRASA